MEKYKEAVKVFKAFDDEKRLQILEMIRAGEKCACVILDMKILCESGIVRGRKEGKWVHYSIDEEGSQRALKLMASLTSVKDIQQ